MQDGCLSSIPTPLVYICIYDLIYASEKVCHALFYGLSFGGGGKRWGNKNFKLSRAFRVELLRIRSYNLIAAMIAGELAQIGDKYDIKVKDGAWGRRFMTNLFHTIGC